MTQDPNAAPTEVPAWADGATVVETYDADAMIDDGQAPVGPVLRRAASLTSGEVLLLHATFAPSPLVAKARAAGHRAELVDDGGGRFRLFIGAGDVG